MKALTLHQPWASLVALGVKRIETRSWPAPASVVGQRVAIHAGKSLTGFEALPGDCEGTTEAGWRYGYVGDYQAGYCYRSSDEGRRGDTFMVKSDGGSPTPDFDDQLPLGAVVASATLRACASIGGPYSFRTGLVEGDEGDYPGQPVVVYSPGVKDWLPESLTLYDADTCSHDISDQLPYGDFTPGRWAWLLDYIEPLTEPVPAKGRQGLWNWEPAL